jgi:hypothetical protein
MELIMECFKELFTALAKAQAEIEVAELSRENPFFKSRYAGFTEIVKASRPHLTKYGLSVIQPIVTVGDQILLRTMLCHSSGEYIVSEMPINPPKTDVQSLGSYITYVRRYSYISLVGVCTGEDDDGEKAVAQSRPTYQSTYVKNVAPRQNQDF